MAAYSSYRDSGKRTARLLIFILLVSSCCGSTLTPRLAHAERSAAWRQAPSNPLTTWSVTIVLPPRVVAGQPATLATLGVDGRLASGVAVEIGDQQVTTDRTGRASFVVPSASASQGYLIAKASGASVAALVDSAAPALGASALKVASAIALHDRFAICGIRPSGDANDDLVKINGQLALVLAASPECLVALPGPKAVPGPATVFVVAPGLEASTSTALVALEFEPPNPPLQPGAKGKLTLRVQGSDQPLSLIVDNETPGVLRFERRQAQQMVTSGGAQNVAEIKVLGVTSGNFSFHARLTPAPDVAVARTYLVAAEHLAPKYLQGDVKKLAGRLTHHPNDSQAVASALDDITSTTIASDFRTLLSAARAVL
jgi:hypothetical protein